MHFFFVNPVSCAWLTKTGATTGPQCESSRTVAAEAALVVDALPIDTYTWGGAAFIDVCNNAYDLQDWDSKKFEYGNLFLNDCKWAKKKVWVLSYTHTKKKVNRKYRMLYICGRITLYFWLVSRLFTPVSTAEGVDFCVHGQFLSCHMSNYAPSSRRSQ